MFPFLDPNLADAEGLVAVGGDLEPATLLNAYRRGIFPWYDEGWPICWWSPDPRTVFELNGFHVPRRLSRTMRSGRFQITINQAFADVMTACGERAEGTWITNDMRTAYLRMHLLGHAHSVDIWQDGQLAGGLYGLALGGFFSGESMFFRRRDASKVALVFLVEHLQRRGFVLFDTQMLTDHTARLGAREISRQDYLLRLQAALATPASFLCE